VDGLWATKSDGVGLSVPQLVFKISNLCGPDPPTLRTDRRTTCDPNTALCTKVHRAVKMERSTVCAYNNV